MSHLVVAYPTLDPDDRAWIDQVRACHHRDCAQIIAPHVTLVFPHVAPDPAALVAHVRRCAAGVPRISFALRCCIAMPEADGRASLFLVPDEGFSAIARLHDTLYTDQLAPQLRHDLPFIPHLTVGLVAQPARSISDALNRDLGAIRGSLDALDVITRDPTVATLAHIRLDA